jgi:hypothetical protein
MVAWGAGTNPAAAQRDKLPGLSDVEKKNVQKVVDNLDGLTLEGERAIQAEKASQSRRLARSRAWATPRLPARW